MRCTIGSECNDLSSASWYHYGYPNTYTVLNFKRRKRCISCSALINNGEHGIAFGRYRATKQDSVEEKILGDEKQISDGHFCEKCTDILFNLEDLGYDVMECNMYIALDMYHEYVENQKE